MTNKKKKKIWSLLVLSGALVALLGVYVGLKGKDVSEENLENGKIEISCNQINSRELPVEKVLGKETKKLEQT